MVGARRREYRRGGEQAALSGKSHHPGRRARPFPRAGQVGVGLGLQDLRYTRGTQRGADGRYVPRGVARANWGGATSFPRGAKLLKRILAGEQRPRERQRSRSPLLKAFSRPSSLRGSRPRETAAVPNAQGVDGQQRLTASRPSGGPHDHQHGKLPQRYVAQSVQDAPHGARSTRTFSLSVPDLLAPSAAPPPRDSIVILP